VSYADSAVGNVTASLKAKGMWDNTLVVVVADNGGWVSKAGIAGGNNYPLKGGKYNNWEGGIRANSFVSGGFLPASRRGIKYSGLVTGWDWYATFAALAGVDATDHRAAAANLPPIDSHDLSNVILGKQLESPRKEIPIGSEPRSSDLKTAPLCSSYSSPQLYDDSAVEAPTTGKCSTVVGLISDDARGLWKLIIGDEAQYVGTGEFYPNSTTNFNSQDPEYIRHCGNGCLFELNKDPLETTDLAKSMPRRVAKMRAKVEHYALSAFNPHRGREDPAACDAAENEHGGFWGPWIGIGKGNSFDRVIV